MVESQVRPVSSNHPIMSLATSFLKSVNLIINKEKLHFNYLHGHGPLNVVDLWSCIVKFQKSLCCGKKMNLTSGSSLFHSSLHSNTSALLHPSLVVRNVDTNKAYQPCASVAVFQQDSPARPPLTGNTYWHQSMQIQLVRKVAWSFPFVISNISDSSSRIQYSLLDLLSVNIVNDQSPCVYTIQLLSAVMILFSILIPISTLFWISPPLNMFLLISVPILIRHTYSKIITVLSEYISIEVHLPWLVRYAWVSQPLCSHECIIPLHKLSLQICSVGHSGQERSKDNRSVVQSWSKKQISILSWRSAMSHKFPLLG